MRNIPTTAPGTVGVQVSPGPGGGLFLSLHVSSGYLMVLLTSQEAHAVAQTMSSLLTSHREPEPPQSGADASPSTPRPPR